MIAMACRSLADSASSRHEVVVAMKRNSPVSGIVRVYDEGAPGHVRCAGRA